MGHNCYSGICEGKVRQSLTRRSSVECRSWSQCSAVNQARRGC